MRAQKIRNVHTVNVEVPERNKSEDSERLLLELKMKLHETNSQLEETKKVLENREREFQMLQKHDEEMMQENARLKTENKSNAEMPSTSVDPTSLLPVVAPTREDDLQDPVDLSMLKEEAIQEAKREFADKLLRVPLIVYAVKTEFS